MADAPIDIEIVTPHTYADPKAVERYGPPSDFEKAVAALKALPLPHPSDIAPEVLAEYLKTARPNPFERIPFPEPEDFKAAMEAGLEAYRMRLLPTGLSKMVNVSVPPTPEEEQRRAVEVLDMAYPPGRVLALCEIQSLLDGVKVGPWPFPKARFRAQAKDYTNSFAAGGPDEVWLYLRYEVDVQERNDPDRSTPLTFESFKHYPREAMTRTVILHEVRDFFLRVVTHELDEMIMVHGARVFDPHKGGRTDF